MTPLLFFTCVLFAIVLIVSALDIARLIGDIRLTRQTRRIFDQFERDGHKPID